MTSQPDHQRVRAIFSVVLDVPPSERAARLRAACDGDEALRAEVEELLAHHDATAGLLPDEQAGLGLDLISETTGGPSLPEQIGPYRIQRLLGRGGMGVVYLAEQQDLRRTVALKVMRAGAAQAELQARFKREVRLLGQLRHPGIAPLYEAGTAEVDGHPCAYFAMEYVEGQSLTDFVARAQPDRHARLALFAEICDAVQHAHEHGIIHRDLKPANILVDGSGRPRVLDFGVARMTHSDKQTLTLETNVGQIVGTLQYMSPEQISGQTDTLDARSDVYALGVIAFQLLVGQLPYPLKGQTMVQIARTIQEVEPTRVGRVDTALRGDVETILAKALEKDRTRRYRSVADLSADVRAYLRHEPIQARPATTLYQLRKFAERNTALVTGVAIAMTALLVGFIVSTSLYLQADEARQHAETQQLRAERDAARFAAINTFLVDDLLAASNPWEDGGRSVTVAQTLDNASSGMADRFTTAPEIECSIRGALAASYRALGLFHSARPHYERALSLVDGLDLPDDTLRFELLHGLAENLKELGSYDEAEAIAGKAQTLAETTFGPEAPQATAILQTIGGIQMHQGRFEQAEETLQNVRTRLEQVDADPVTRARAINELGSTLYYATRFEEAMALKQETLQLLEDALGPDDPHVAQALNDIGSTLSEREQFEESETYLRRALPLLEQHLGDDHVIVLICRRTLANTLSFTGRDDQAEPLMVEVIADCQAALGPTHPETLAAINSLATLRLRASRSDEALGLLQRLFEASEESRGPRHPETIKYASNLAWCHAHLRQIDQAEALFRRASTAAEATLGLAHADCQRAFDGLAQLLAGQERFQDAADALQKVLEGRRLAKLPKDLDHALFLHRYGSLVMQAGDYAEACPPLEACVQICDEGFPPDDWRTALARSKLGECLSRSGACAKAEAALLASARAHESVPQSASLVEATRTRLAEHYRRCGQPERAAEWETPVEPDPAGDPAE